METNNHNQIKHVAFTTALVLYFTLLIFLAVFSSGCNKKTTDEQAEPAAAMEIKMTDAPAAFLSVYVDVKELRIHYADETIGSGGWVSLNTNARVYDLLQLRNNVTAVLSNESDLQEGRVTQIRLILGENNYVITADSIPFPLIIPSSEESGLKIKTDINLVKNSSTEVVIDFDAAASIKDFITTAYKMSPVITIKSTKQK